MYEHLNNFVVGNVDIDPASYANYLGLMIDCNANFIEG